MYDLVCTRRPSRLRRYNKTLICTSWVRFFSWTYTEQHCCRQLLPAIRPSVYSQANVAGNTQLWNYLLYTRQLCCWQQLRATKLVHVRPTFDNSINDNSKDGTSNSPGRQEVNTAVVREADLLYYWTAENIQYSLVYM